MNWISVKDKLPDNYMDILIYVPESKDNFEGIHQGEYCSITGFSIASMDLTIGHNNYEIPPFIVFLHAVHFDFWIRLYGLNPS